MRLWPLVATVYFCVSGGPQGLEEVMQSGAGMGLLLIAVTPLIWALPAALMSSELGSALPVEGGYIVWVRRAFGENWAFLCGWWTWIFSWVDASIYPVLFAEYLAVLVRSAGFVPLFDDAHPWFKWLVGLTVIVPLTWLNIRGANVVGRMSLIFFCVLLAPFTVLVALGLHRVVQNPSLTVHPFLAGGATPAAAFGGGLFVVMWNYLGWDSLSTIAGEVRDARRTFPRALMIGVPIVTLGYLLPAIVGIVALHDPAKWERGAWSEAAQIVGGPWLSTAVTFVGLVSAAGLFSATLLASSRIPFVLALNNVLPSAVTKTHPKWQTPANAILVSAAVYTLLSFNSFKSLAVIDVIVYSAGILLEFGALVALRIREPDLERPFKIGGGTVGLTFVVVAPTVVVIFAIASQLTEERHALALSAIAILSGPAWWFASKRGKTRHGSLRT